MNRQAAAQRFSDPYDILIHSRINDLEREAIAYRQARLARSARRVENASAARGALRPAWRGWTAVQCRIADAVCRALRLTKFRAAPAMAGSAAPAAQAEVDR